MKKTKKKNNEKKQRKIIEAILKTLFFAPYLVGLWHAKYITCKKQDEYLYKRYLAYPSNKDEKKIKRGIFISATMKDAFNLPPQYRAKNRVILACIWLIVKQAIQISILVYFTLYMPVLDIPVLVAIMMLCLYVVAAKFIVMYGYKKGFMSGREKYKELYKQAKQYIYKSYGWNQLKDN